MVSEGFALRLILALCVAFAAPLLGITGEENGGFHFRGASTVHPPGVWPGNEEVKEITLFYANRPASITIIIYPDQAPVFHRDEDEPEDTYDRLTSFSN